MSITAITTRIDRKYLDRKSKHELVAIILANLDRIDLFASPGLTPDPPKGSLRELAEAASNIAAWLRWDMETLEDFHAYGQLFGQPGNNVHKLVLADALKLRGLSLQDIRGKQRA